ncbi:hypothetical protein D3C85_1170670 [compost metagenome]
MVRGRHMEERRPGDEPILTANAVLAGVGHSARHAGPLADHGALGKASGSAGVEDQESVFGVHVGPRGFAILECPHERFADRRLVQVDHPRDAVRQRVQRLPVAAGHDNDGRLDQAKAMQLLGALQTPVQAGDHGAQPRCGELQLQVLGPVLGPDGQPLAAPQSANMQERSPAAHPDFQLAIGQSPACVTNRFFFRMHPRALEEQVGQAQLERCGWGIHGRLLHEE